MTSLVGKSFESHHHQISNVVADVSSIRELTKAFNSFKITDKDLFVKFIIPKFGFSILNEFSTCFQSWLESQFDMFLNAIAASASVASTTRSTDKISISKEETRRMELISDLFTKLVLHFNLPIISVLPFLWKLIATITSANKDTKNSLHKLNTTNTDNSAEVKEVSPSEEITTSFQMFTSFQDIHLFLSHTLIALAPLIKPLGHTIVNELVHTAYIKASLPGLITALTSHTSDDSGGAVPNVSSSSSSGSSGVHFKLTETFTKTFNEDTDSRNEYKSSQVSVCCFCSDFVSKSFNL